MSFFLSPKTLRSLSIFSLLASTAVVFTVAAPASPVRAVGDVDITVGDSLCDLTAAGLGRGTAQDPYVINTAKSLSEIRDCNSRDFTITGASVNGTDVTFTVNNRLGVGHSVTISSVTPSDFDVNNVRVIAATPTTLTVRYPSVIVASYGSGGTITVDRDYYELAADIDLSVSDPDWNDLSSASSPGWTPLPDLYNISFDGNNKIINGLTIRSNEDKRGLFSDLRVSSIQNLILTNASINQSGSQSRADVGVLLGYGEYLNLRSLDIRNSNVIGSKSSMGLLAGRLTYSNIADVSSSGSVGASNPSITGSGDFSKEPTQMGGLIGELGSSNLSQASSTSDVSGYITQGASTLYGQEIGGLVGKFNEGNISDSHATGNVVGRKIIGGLIGNHNCCGDIHNSYATGSVTTIINASINGDNVGYSGGLLGKWSSSGSISQSYSTGNVSVQLTEENLNVIFLRQVGGFIGETQCCGVILDSYSTGNVSVSIANMATARHISYIGGFTGQWNCCGAFSNVYAIGNVSVRNDSTGGESRYIGGFVGEAACCGSLTDARSTGDISIVSRAGDLIEYVGGFVGFTGPDTVYTNVHAEGDITTSNGRYVGGFAGYSDFANQYIYSSSKGDISTNFDGEVFVGGFIGRTNRNNSIERSFSTGTVQVSPFTSGASASKIGGFIGEVGGPLELNDSFVRSTVEGPNIVGGLFGTSGAHAVSGRRVYVANTVTATGTNPIVDAVSNGAFTDVNGTNVFDQSLSGSLPNKANFSGKTTAEMKTQSTFTALGFAFEGDSPVWKISSTENDGYPQLILRPRRTSTSSTGTSGSSTPQIVEVPARAATCVAPASLKLTFRNGSSRLTAKANRQIRSYVTKVKSSNCTQLNLQAFYVKNSPLARTRNRVLVDALKKEFWRQQYVVRIRTSVKATKSRGAQERTVQLSVPR